MEETEEDFFETTRRISAALTELRENIFPRIKPEARKRIMQLLAKDYCDLCMGAIPCYCAPCFDV